ncbi:MAG: response regulator [Halobacteriovoraceae bacterium]|jgi:two-component system, NtrC family, nitrogen regulation response regulator NtrX|nr:response regulator [Halobacteriovoraceae bacterium]
MSEEQLKDIKILIVDDEKILRETLESYLLLEGAKITQAENGNKAYELLVKNKYDIVLSDIRMPGCSGIKLLAMLRTSSLKMPPFVLMSAFTDITSDKAKSLGARGLFLKPNDLKKLTELLVESLDDF